MFKYVILAQAVLIQIIAGQCICGQNGNWGGIVKPHPCEIPLPNPGPCHGSGYPGYPGHGYPDFGIDVASLSNNHGFAVTSSSPIAPGSLSISSENYIEGPLSVVGELPFLSAVAFEGSMPSGGYGAVAYSCGNGNVGILSESEGGYSGWNGVGGAGWNGVGGAGWNGLGSGWGNGYSAGCGNSGWNSFPKNHGFGGCGCL